MFRPMRRKHQQLPHELCEKILSEEPRGVLAVLGDEGYPYAVPLDFVYEDGRLYFHSATEGHKIDAIQGCSKCSFSVMERGELDQDGWSYYFDSVIVFGRISVMRDRDAIRERLTSLGRKYFPCEQMVTDEVNKFADKVAMLELIPEHISGKRVHEK